MANHMCEETGMNCNDHQQTINRFIDHEVKAKESVLMFEHLVQCAGCRQFYDSIISVGVELDKARYSIDDRAEVVVYRQPNYSVVGHKRIAPRPSTLAFVIVVMLVVGLLFSVNVTIEEPAQIQPTTTASQR
jgi:predicted anti-sigma-YlaC factor YlaD